MRIKTEHAKRKVDPFELQVFQEQLSENLKVQQEAIRQNDYKKELDTLSLAPSSAYQGFNKTKKHVKNKK